MALAHLHSRLASRAWLGTPVPAAFVASITLAITMALAFAAPRVVLSQTNAGSGSSWSVQLVSEGGITGKGLGSVAAKSDGTLQLLERTNAQAPASGHAEYRAICSMPLTADQRARLSSAVAAATPSKWEARYANTRNPYAGADEILTTLTFERTASNGVEKKEVQWISEREGTLPADLAAVRQALMAAMPKGGCTM